MQCHCTRWPSRHVVRRRVSRDSHSVGLHLVIGHIVSVLIFLVAITVVAELADSAGVFTAAAALAARLGRGRVWLLWLATSLVASVSTIFLSLDTTAVLLTPVVVTMAIRLGIPALPFAMTTVWLANTASLLLPVSNLTNLLALPSFNALGIGYHGMVGWTWRPAVVAIVVTIVTLAVMFRHSLRGTYVPAPAGRPADRLRFVVAAVVCVALAAMLASGVNVVYPAVAAALVLVVVTAVRSRETLSWGLLPVRPVVLATALFTVVGIAGQLGLTRVLSDLLPTGPDPGALFGLGLGSALAANLVDNLPAFFALLPVADDHPARLVAVLIGTNVAPLVTMWASLANILWRQRCARAGLEISRLGFAARGAILAPIVTAASLAALSWL